MFNIFSTLNKNLQNFGGDAYDAYQAGKSKVGNVASTINTNLQNFGGDLYDAGNQIKNNVSNFASDTKKSILAPADRFMTDVTKIGNARKATEYGLNNKDKDALMSQMLDEGIYSDEDIIQAVNQLDAEERARKQKEFSDWQSGNKANASIGQKALAGITDFSGGMAAGMMRIPAGVTDFALGGTDYTKDTMQGINDFTSRNGAAKFGDIAGQIAATSIIPGISKIAPSGAGMGATIGRGAVYGGAFGGLTPIMNNGSEATLDEIWQSAITGAGLGAAGGLILEKGLPSIIKGAQSGVQAGKFADGGITQKTIAGTQAFGKSVGRQTAQGVREVGSDIASVYQKAAPLARKPVEGYRNAVQSLLSNRSDKTKNIIAQTYGMENQEIGAIRSVGKDEVTKMMDKMDAIDQKALAGGGVNSIYDDLHKKVMGGVQKRSSEMSALENQKEALLKNSNVVIKKSELDDLFDDVLRSQGIKRTEEITKKGVRNKYSVVGEGNITSSDINNINKLYDELIRTKGDVNAVNMNTRIKNLQSNVFNKADDTGAMGRTSKEIVAKANELLKNKLPKEYRVIKSKQSEIIEKRNAILKFLKEEDNALALLPDEKIATMSEQELTKIINDSIAGNKMALFLRRLANSTTTGGDAKQLANIIKEFTGLDVENQAIALRAIAKMTGNKQILNELGGLLDKGVVKSALKLGQKILTPSPEKVIKAVATPSPKSKPPIIKKK